MPRALFVSLKNLYPELSAPGRARTAAALRNVTSGWWRINEARAHGVTYLFGVHDSAAVSAYRIDIDVAQWPRMPAGAMGAGRRYVPVTSIADDSAWVVAQTWRIEMFGPIRYGDVALDAQGNVTGVSFPETARDDELDEESGE